MKIIIYFNEPSKKEFFFHKTLLDNYLKQKAHIQKLISKAPCIFKNLLETFFHKLKFEN
jgi:hypothetical protein